jgi:hypothetical protein
LTAGKDTSIAQSVATPCDGVRVAHVVAAQASGGPCITATTGSYGDDDHLIITSAAVAVHSA